MILRVDAVSQAMPCPAILFSVDSQEAAFEQLNSLINEGFHLKQAFLIDEDNRLSIPIEAFDGQPIEVHLRGLQHQWVKLLSTMPAPPSNGSGMAGLKNWLVQMDAYYEALLIYLEKTIVLLQIKKINFQIWRDNAVRTRLSYQCDSLLAINQRIHQRTLESRRKNQQRMQELQN